ncbi:ImmA/IrrE family metallo-endopeptidase [Companilactobacillus hulinensis]|uniref:ImmA/IrrE family metallo-endopeptidase n=1 Tax=Companilactobacillus hulinensis TaxID=2486007 RepID=UPI000F7A9CA2|nr:ImmA/IrrE family metallo-endopeptidase [Companilactobacillus hulinensis]
MINDVTTYLMNLAYDNKTTVIIEDKFSEYTPAAVNTNTKIIVLNSKWYRPNQIPFQLAHELGHILNNDGAKACLYFSPSKFGIEGHANKTAIHLLVPLFFGDTEYMHANTVRFMDAFGIPPYMESVVTSEIKDYYN